MTLAFLFFVSGGCSARDQVLRPDGGVIPREFFGLHIHKADTGTPWPRVAFGSWRLWDAYVAWPNLEPAQGKWDFSRLDRYVAMARLTNVEVLLPLGLTPTWASARPKETSAYGAGMAAEPAAIENWRRYVRTVAERYKGRIKLYEIWNEPNDRAFYSGSIETMVNLVAEASAILKAVDPEITLLSPAVTGGGKHLLWLDRFLQAGGKRHIDVIAYHFYVAESKPEAMLELAAGVKKIRSKHGMDGVPIWNTEAGWLIESKEPAPPSRDPQAWLRLDADNGAAFVARALVLAWASGLSRYYWYSWDGDSIGLTEPESRTPKPAGVAYGQVIKWLRGATLKDCRSDADLWSCEITDAQGRSSWMIWAAGEPRKFKAPGGKAITGVESLDGTRYIPGDSERFELYARSKPVLISID